MGQQLPSGAWLLLTTPIFHTLVERGQLQSGLLLYSLFQDQSSCGGILYKHKITHLTAINWNITLLGIFTFICQQVFNNYQVFIK